MIMAEQITTTINEIQNRDRSYIYIPEEYRHYFPEPHAKFEVIDSKTDKGYFVHLENSYRIPGLRNFFKGHTEIRKGTKIIIEVREQFKTYNLYVDQIPDELDQTVKQDLEIFENENFTEGGTSIRLVNYFERNPELRTAAIRIHGTTCMACGFNFEKKYGKHGKDFIEVHHLNPVSQNLEKKNVAPNEDLVVVCSNCHRMIHRNKTKIMSLEDLKKLIKIQN
ncbi:MAG: HNH endonuclease [Deltaproteobacteria bacterium]|nr:HNH endonuclease [Deltaproteobacteria bacterium]